MSSQLLNSGIRVFNPRACDTATLIIVGIERSGTSMIANVLKELGVHLGDKHDGSVFEDAEISNAIEKDDSRALEKLIRKNNKRYDIWGWKRPRAYKYPQKYLGKVRNPKFIITFRDSFAISVRNSISVFSETSDNLVRTARQNLALSQFVADREEPMLCVSYEKALANKQVFVDELIDYVGISPSQKQIEAAVASIENGKESYLTASRIKFQGKVDKIADGLVVGWARQIGTPMAVELELLLDGVVVENIVADRYRADLERHGIGDGNHAFRAHLPDEAGELQLRIKKSGALLPLGAAAQPSEETA